MIGSKLFPAKTDTVARSFANPDYERTAANGLRLAKQVLDQLGITYWLSNGTLLGCMRDERLIPHDTDMDLGVWDDTPNHQSIFDAFIKAGFRPSHKCEYGRPGEGHEYSFYVPDDDIKLDIFFYVKETDHCWMGLWVGQELRKMVFPIVEDFTGVPLYGETYTVPQNWEAMLVANYGVSWREPDRKWIWQNSPKNFEPEILNADFWREYYSKPHELGPSSFAQWVGLSGKKIIDFGCGNGRDTRFLAQKNDVIGVDAFAPSGDLFVRMSIENFLSGSPQADVAYCRFIFHAIAPEVQKAIIDWVVKNQAMLCAEFRSTQDKPDTTHYRRLIDGNEFLVDLMGKGFKLLSYHEGFGLSPYKGEDPHLVRVIACVPKKKEVDKSLYSGAPTNGKTGKFFGIWKSW